MGSYLSIITLNVNGLNAPTKRQRLAEWIQKQDPYVCCLQETHLKTGDTYRLKVKGWKKIFYANRDQKKAGVAILTSDKIDFKTLKGCEKRQRWSLHNDQRINPRSSVQFSRSVMSDSLRPHELQNARHPCPSPTPGVHSDSRPSSR